MKYYFLKTTEYYPDNVTPLLETVNKYYIGSIQVEYQFGIALGYQAGNTGQGTYSIDIGYNSKRYDMTYIYNYEYTDATKITYDMNGQIKTKEWIKENGEYREEGGPAIVIYENGKPKYNEYWENGKMKCKIEVSN